MKIKIKKIIASVLTFMMVFTQVPVNVFAETKGESIPLDITLVLDVSGSMDDPLSGGTKRMSVLKDSVYQLIDEFSTKNTNIEDVSKQNRIAIVKFAGDKNNKVGNDTYTSGGYRYNYTQVVSDYVAVQDTNKGDLKEKVKTINASGATNSQAAMELTKNLVNSSVNDTNRRYAKRVVIFVTDGVPTTQSSFDDDVANNAISIAKSIKKNAFIYSIGLSAKTNKTIVGDDGDGNWTETEKFNAYLHGISSNYPNATDYKNLGNKLNGANYYRGVKSSTEAHDTFAEIIRLLSNMLFDLADYTKVNEAKAKVPSNLNIYTEETVNALQEALDAVEEGKNITEQETVDGYAKAINEAINSLVIKDANYKKVNEAKAKVPNDLNIYTEETVNALQEALDAVEEGKNITEQETVDGYANAINEAISKLVLKDADYKKVNEAKAKVPSYLNIYTEETVNALQEALDAVEEGKNITEQETVDGYAKAIYEAISKLVLKDATSTKQEAVTPTVRVETTNKETVKAENKKEVKKVKTGDSTNSVLYLGLFGFSLLIIYCIVMKKFIR
ncbi:VWA domain-containing protein [Faecalibacillus faecis]|uniref:VWA domain-containing protein n=1 Tax=Faecalibacillus faecis TaxID=1982628 RepID=UPI0018ABAE56|nr:vWA domain-containing protein [Faecalibacillus faecis]